MGQFQGGVCLVQLNVGASKGLEPTMRNSVVIAMRRFANLGLDAVSHLPASGSDKVNIEAEFYTATARCPL